MRIVLEPMSHPEVGVINVTDDICSIGRDEAPFVALPEHLRAGLSVRHAKVFRQGAVAYIVELGSLGGVTVNGQPVGKGARELRHGDELCIAPSVCFVVRMTATAPQDEPAPSRLFTLLPQDEEGEPIEVQGLPLLIGKQSGPLAYIVGRRPAVAAYLSRRHALIYLRQGIPHIEDLGSTNGTYVDGRRIGEQAVALQHGSTVAFGGDEFAFRVDLAQQPSHEAAREPGTILISAPDSFLDAFCAPMGDADDGGDPGKGGERQHRAKSGAGAQPKSRRSLLRRTWILVGEVRNALAGDDIAQRRHRIRLWVVAGVAIVMVAVPLAMYVTGGTERQIRKLMAEERYAESAALASSHLKNSPGAENVRLLGTESLVRSVAPQWVQSMQAGDRDAAEKVLAQAQEQSEFNQDGLRALALLEWMARVDAFTRDRGGRGAPLEIFRHENEVSDLLQWWEEDSRGHRNLLNRVLNYAPELHPLATESMSQLVALQNESSVYLTAITDLSRTIVSRLGSDAAGELRTVFEDFERRYHAVAGMQRLWMDLERWTAIRDAVEGRDLPLAVRLANQTEFETPPFREAARLHIWPELPPPAIVAEYERAVSAWTNGEWATALATLEELMDRPWGEVAQHRLERYRRVLEEHRALLELSEGPDYGERLLAFYAELHPDEDARFRQGLEEDYQRHRELALAQAGDTFRQASDRWVAYRRNGGIDGLMRLEETVSDLFRAQSSLLSRALSDAEEAMHVYRLLRMDTPVPLHQVHDDIVAEVRRQRQWLEDMHIVLDSSLLEAKLALLPASREVEP